jgi:hypothetical protein
MPLRAVSSAETAVNAAVIWGIVLLSSAWCKALRMGSTG